jgi:hypothetical protein
MATTDKTIACSRCDGTLEFGGASRGMVKMMGGMCAVMQAMAGNAGWTRSPKGEWTCRFCNGSAQ